MCGRYTLTRIENLLQYFPWVKESPLATERERYNIAPTQPVLGIANNHPDRLEHFHWGLIPSWAKDRSIGARMINARAETLATKPAFRTALRRRRCLVPADGFYEWRKDPGGKTKTPYHIRLKSREPFAFAGLWDTWHGDDGSALLSCTLITGEPNALLAPIHDRMAVIIPRQHYARWIEPREQEPAALADLLRPYPAEEMEAFPVTKAVNNAKNESPACVEPAPSGDDRPPAQPLLFG